MLRKEIIAVLWKEGSDCIGKKHTKYEKIKKVRIYLKIVQRTAHFDRNWIFMKETLS